MILCEVGDISVKEILLQSGVHVGPPTPGAGLEAGPQGRPQAGMTGLQRMTW
jgi:hypothetical protein